MQFAQITRSHNGVEIQRQFLHHLELGEEEDARVCCESILRQKVDSAKALHFAGLIEKKANRHANAIHHFERALVKNLAAMGTRYQLAECLYNRAEHQKLNLLLRTTIKRLAARGKYYVLFAKYFARMEEFEIAEKFFIQGIQLDIDTSEIRYQYARLLTQFGFSERAQTQCEICLQDDPNYYQAWLLLAEQKQQTPSSNHLPELLSLIESGIPSATGKAIIHYAATKEYEDLGFTEKAFEQMQYAGTILKSVFTYPAEQDKQQIKQLQNLFNSSYISKCQNSGYKRNNTIFIVGLPGTGLGLVEQLLCTSEYIIRGGDEQQFSRVLLDKTDGDVNNLQAFSTHQPNSGYREIGMLYSKITGYRRKGPGYLTDTTVDNFRWLGPILLALPGAKIIHVRRNVVATCAGLYKRYFANSHSYSYDLGHIADHYILYDQIMKHWQGCFPNSILDIQFEDLVTSASSCKKKILDFCDIPFNENGSMIEKTAVIPGSGFPAAWFGSLFRHKSPYENHLTRLKNYLQNAGVDTSQ